MLSPADPDTDGTLSPTDPAGVLFPAVLTEFPVLMDPVVTLLPPDPAVLDTGSVADMAVVEEVRPAVPDVFDCRAVVAMVGTDAVHTGEGIPMDCDDNYDMRDPRNDFETVHGMPVYYGGDLMTRTVRILVIWLMRIGWIGIILTLQKDVVLISRIRGKPDCPMLGVLR